MSAFLRHIVRAVVVSVLMVVSLPVTGDEDSRPIIDVRFDGPYGQVIPSRGDEWAPTWGRNDVLYTGNNDGDSFGGVAINTMAFGKLEGNDPRNLKGVTVNGMWDYAELDVPGPVGARWKTLESYEVEGLRYRFSVCGLEPDRSQYSCLIKSADGGKTWVSNTAGTENALFRGRRFSAPSFIAFNDKSLALMGDDAPRYAYAAAYTGVVDGVDQYVLGRVLRTKLALAAVKADDWSFQHNSGAWIVSSEDASTTPNSTRLGRDGANWKTTNTYSVDGVLYMFVTRNTYPSGSEDSKHRHVWRNSSIIKSHDDGRSWIPSAQDSLTKPMFPGQRFGTAYFVWYEKDGAAASDNADKYVYAVSNNGHFENGDDYVLGRVLRTRLTSLSGDDWSFYVGGNGVQDDSWTAELDQAQPILKNPGRSGMTGMTYIPHLKRYVMVTWHYNQQNFEAATRAKDLSTVLEFFEAPKPWGPWTKVKSYETGRLGWFVPVVGQRFQEPLGTGAVQAFLYPAGFSTKPEGGLDFALYKFNYLPITLSTKPLKHKDSAYAGGRSP